MRNVWQQFGMVDILALKKVCFGIGAYTRVAHISPSPAVWPIIAQSLEFKPLARNAARTVGEDVPSDD